MTCHVHAAPTSFCGFATTLEGGTRGFRWKRWVMGGRRGCGRGPVMEAWGGERTATGTGTRVGVVAGDGA